jgi:Nickel responsive protein SCO4226-like
MRKFIVERALPQIGGAEGEELNAVARSFNSTLRRLGSDIQWVQSYVSRDKTFCVFYAPDEDTLRDYMVRTGFPADSITEIRTVIDPTTHA